MATNFPISLDAYNNPQPTDDVSVVVHSTQHANHNDSIEAIEAKLGIDSSAVTTSIDYLLKSSSSSDPGHKHTSASFTAPGSDTEIPFNDGGTALGTDSVFVWKKTTNRLGVGTASPDTTLHAEYSGSETTATIFPVRIGHITSGAASSIGVGAEYELENADGTNFIGGSHEIKMTGNGGGTESADYVLELISSGSKAEKFRVYANGNAALVGDLTVSDEAYGAGWNGSLEVPTKNAVYDKIQALPSGITIGDTITSATANRLLYVGAGPVLAQTGSTVYLSSDNLYFDQTGTGANQDTKGLYFKPTYSDGTVRTTFGVYAKGLGSNSYPEMIIGGTGATEAKIRIRSLNSAGETIYFHATDVDFSNVSGPIYLKKLYLASPGESPHATEKLFLRSTANIIGAGFEIAHYGATPQEIVYIHNNPWTGASSGGAMYTIRLRSDTTDWNLAANWTATWATATHASRKGRVTFNVYDTAIREGIRIEASGSAPMVGFYGTTAVVQAANTTDLGTVLSDVGLRASGTAYPITTSGNVSFTGTIGLGGQITISDAIDIALNTTTGTKIGTSTSQKIGLWNKTPVVQPTALTTQLTSITHTAPGTPDYAIQDLVDSSGGAAFGFATKDEGNTVLSVIANLQTRVQELETKLQSFGAIA